MAYVKDSDRTPERSNGGSCRSQSSVFCNLAPEGAFFVAFIAAAPAANTLLLDMMAGAQVAFPTFDPAKSYGHATSA
jgi:hypothetical protein